MIKGSIPESTLRRFPKYLAFVEALAAAEWDYVTSADIARACDLKEVLVRKDMAYTGVTGRPHFGYPIHGMIGAIIDLIGWNRPRRLAVVGAERPAEAVLSLFPFHRYGLTVAAIVDDRPEKAGQEINGVKIIDSATFEVGQNAADPIRIVLLSVPVSVAQPYTDRLAACGVRAIWNFTQASLTAPDEVQVVDVGLAAGLAVLCRSLTDAGL